MNYFLDQSKRTHQEVQNKLSVAQRFFDVQARHVLTPYWNKTTGWQTAYYPLRHGSECLVRLKEAFHAFFMMFEGFFYHDAESGLTHGKTMLYATFAAIVELSNTFLATIALLTRSMVTWTKGFGEQNPQPFVDQRYIDGLLDRTSPNEGGLNLFNTGVVL